MDINPGQILSLALASRDLRADAASRLGDVKSRINDLRGHMDSRFDEMRATWHSELRRVEEVLDARLKHLEER